MKPFLRPLAALTCFAAVAAAPGKAPPPPLPTGQYDIVLFGAQSKDDGERLFGQKCGFCHIGARNTGTMMLGRRMPKDKAELPKRTDLDADYVKAVVRNGLVNMPPFTKAELPDADLDKVAKWLARKKKP